MADKKISELNNATLPLAGTEVIPIVQGGETKKVAVSEIGGSQTLAQTLALGNETDGENINISDGDAIILDNGSKLIKGTTNAGLGGNKGIALRCSIDYELKWEAGRLYVMEQDGFTIREVSYNFADTPTATDDITKGFVVGSRWILDNGDLYVCEDASTGIAAWGLTNYLDLQQVTDNGNTTTNPLEIYNYVRASAFRSGADDITFTDASGNTIFYFEATGDFSPNFRKALLTAVRNYECPDASGTIALTSDIPTVDATPTDGSSNAVSSNGVFDALALKQDFATDSFASTITFDVPKVYNSFSSPSSSNVSQNLTGAKIGVVQKFYSNKATEPTYPAGWVKLFGTYTNSATNIIYAEWCEGSRVEYWIVEA